MEVDAYFLEYVMQSKQRQERELDIPKFPAFQSSATHTANCAFHLSLSVAATVRFSRSSKAGTRTESR